MEIAQLAGFNVEKLFLLFTAKSICRSTTSNKILFLACVSGAVESG